MAAQQSLQRFAHGWVAVQRQQQGGIGEAIQHRQKAPADLLQPLTPVLTPVHGGQQHALLLPVEAGQMEVRRRLRHPQQGIDHRVAGDDRFAHHPGSLQVRGRLSRGGEVQLGQLGDQATIRLLREGIEQVVGAQAGLHMPHRNLLVEGSQGTGKSGGGVALHQHQIGALAGEFLLQPLQGRTGDVGERLVGGHQGQIVIGLQTEQIHHLAHHLAMLAGEHHSGAEILGGQKSQDHRGQLDRLRPGAQNDGDQGARRLRQGRGLILGGGRDGAGGSVQSRRADPLILERWIGFNPAETSQQPSAMPAWPRLECCGRHGRVTVRTLRWRQPCTGGGERPGQPRGRRPAPGSR